ncbi:MAG: hypothetical protein K0Q95_583 [Bacteroidota bacterium]|jgi:uncharacterized membrane protein YgdD (TMEM256/DUF423 family)|nr:hypothetical protein [Bacteroidota bacterium]
MQNRFIKFAGFSGAIAVTLGAMAAHYLKSLMERGILSQNELNAFETASKYQIYHSLALLCIGLLIDKLNPKMVARAGSCFMAGTILFSGSLYILSTHNLTGLQNIRWLGPITPIGGVFLITGWIFIALSVITKNKQN